MIEWVALLVLIGITLLQIFGFGKQWVSSGAGIDTTGGGIDAGSETLSFNIDPLTGAISIILTILVVAILIGISIFGAGLSSTSVKIVLWCLFYFGLWGIFSVLSLELLFSIPVFGAFFWVLLTIIYVIGVAQNLMNGGND